MSLNDDLMRQLMALFTVETEEHLQTINQDLLALEQRPSPQRAQDLLAEIFRAAHTLKGSARSVNLDSVGALAHQLETLFARAQKHELELDQPLFDLIYEALDTIAALVRGAASGSPADVDASALGARLAIAGNQDQSQAARLPLAPIAVQASTDSVAAVAALDAAVVPAPRTDVLHSAPPYMPDAPVPGVEATVRIATSKLDSLLAQISELQVTRIGAEQRLADVRALLQEVEEWEGEWRKMRTPYRRLLLASANDGAGESRADARDIGLALEFLQANEQHLRGARTRLHEFQRALKVDNRQMAQVAGDLQDDVRRTRMMPVAVVFDTFPRMVRDLARELNKEVILEIRGAETEVDRTLLEQIKAPLLHLLRNAVDHGIEQPHERARMGKPPVARIGLSASQRGNNIVVEVVDDGAGIDASRVKASALKRELLTPESAAALSDQDALWLIFRTGMSTRTLISDVSGRGIGLDVVRENIDHLHGLIDIESRVGQGTRFTLQIPLTVATTLCLLVRAEGCTFALPVANMTYLIHAGPADIGFVQGRQAVQADGRPVVLSYLSDLLGIERNATADVHSGKQPVIILGSADRRVALMVDELLGTQEIVIKRLPPPLLRVQYAAGAAITGTGAVVLVLHIADLLRAAMRSPAHLRAAPATSQAEKRVATVIIADDSITTRTLEKNILEVAGYQVRAAADGLEAWTLLQTGSCDLLVSDVQMPRMDGFALTEKLRADERFKHLPVILVTALASREDRERGVQAGANAYIVKSAFDQNTLLATIRQLI